MRIHKIHIIAEGSSEKAYFTHLSRICRELDIPLLFEAYPSGGNAPKNVRAQWRKAQTKRDKKHNEEVWAVLDYDSFMRGAQNINSFAFTGNNLYFFVMNFEDFLIHHLSLQNIQQWKTICQRCGHFSSPMHGVDVEREIQQIIPGYRKGAMPFTLCKNHLKYAENNQGNFFICQNVKDFVPTFISFLKQKGVI